MKKALITGITGQDGSYLADLLLEKGYEVHGLVRRSSTLRAPRIEHLKNKIQLHIGDLTDSSSLKKAVQQSKPDEVYNLAAMSHVKTSFDVPEYSADVNATGVIRLLDVLRQDRPSAKFYQASTSELYGKAQSVPQNEKTSFYPRSPYAVSKLFSYWAVVNYREAYDLFACNGILFNHESPRRGENFVSRKITLAAARIKLGLQDSLVLGNLDAKRDWGYAKDFVDGMWRILQQDAPDDYVLATGKTTTVRDFVRYTFAFLDLELEFEGEGAREKGLCKKTGRVLVEVSPEFFRPTEVNLLIGDPAKAKDQLGWQAKTDLESLVKVMVDADLKEQTRIANENSVCA